MLTLGEMCEIAAEVAFSSATTEAIHVHRFLMQLARLKSPLMPEAISMLRSLGSLNPSGDVPSAVAGAVAGATALALPHASTEVAYRPLLDRLSLQDTSLDSLFQVHLQLLALLLYLDREGTGAVTGTQCLAACRALAEAYPNEAAALLAPNEAAALLPSEAALLRTLSLTPGPGGSIAICDVADKFVLVDRLHSNQSHFPQPTNMLRLRQMRQESSISVLSAVSGGSSNASSSRSVLSAVSGDSIGRSVSSPSAVTGSSNRTSPNRDACMGEVTDDPIPPTELLPMSADVGGFEPAAGVVCHEELDGCVPVHMAPLNHRLTLGRLALLTRSIRAKFAEHASAHHGAGSPRAKFAEHAVGSLSSGTLGAVSGATRKQAKGRGPKPYGVMSARLETNLKLPPRARGLDRSDAMLESMDAGDCH